MDLPRLYNDAAKNNTYTRNPMLWVDVSDMGNDGRGAKITRLSPAVTKLNYVIIQDPNTGEDEEIYIVSNDYHKYVKALELLNFSDEDIEKFASEYARLYGSGGSSIKAAEW